jgi:hypothetical protein
MFFQATGKSLVPNKFVFYTKKFTNLKDKVLNDWISIIGRRVLILLMHDQKKISEKMSEINV